MTIRTLLSLVLILSVNLAFAQTGEIRYEAKCIGFYNLENLFDTLDTPNKRDTEFTPDGRNYWNSERYEFKLGQLARVISELGTSLDPSGVAVLGVAEVENKAALDDLVNHPTLAKRGYKTILVEGPDKRGIDVGMIYDPIAFEVESWKSFTLQMEDTSFHTRDQLLVTGDLLGERTHIIVAHWPSRSGGQKRSEPNRIAAAELGRSIMDSIFIADPEASVLYMGDMNDDPVNKSLTKVMKATSDARFASAGKPFNPMYAMYNQGVGSLAWRDTWNLFDQILLSPGLCVEQGREWVYHTTRIYNKPYLATAEGNYKGYPFRTFAGGAWTKGFSDHYPVYVVLKRRVDS